MSPGPFLVGILLVCLAFAASGQSGAPPTDPYVELVKRVQERLYFHGYDVGRVDGVLDMRTQAALAQFQLSRTMPAGAQMNRETLEALGVDWAELEVLRAEAESSSPSAGGSAPSN